MKQHMILTAVAAIALGSNPVLAQDQDQEPKPPLGFFVTSTMHSGNLGGLAGADAECQRLAAAAGAGPPARPWRAEKPLRVQPGVGSWTAGRAGYAGRRRGLLASVRRSLPATRRSRKPADVGARPS